RMHLRRERDFAMAALAGGIDEPAQQRTAGAATAPFLQDRHAADMSIGQEPPGADGASIGIRERVKRRGVVVVHLELGWHALLFDEHGDADALCLGLRSA